MTPPSWVVITVAIITFVIGPIALAWYNNKIKKQEAANKKTLQEASIAKAPSDYADKFITNLFEQVTRLSHENAELTKIKRRVTAENGDLRVEFERHKGESSKELTLLRLELESHKLSSSRIIKDLREQKQALIEENNKLREEIAQWGVNQYE